MSLHKLHPLDLWFKFDAGMCFNVGCSRLLSSPGKTQYSHTKEWQNWQYSSLPNTNIPHERQLSKKSSTHPVLRLWYKFGYRIIWSLNASCNIFCIISRGTRCINNRWVTIVEIEIIPSIAFTNSVFKRYLISIFLKNLS